MSECWHLTAEDHCQLAADCLLPLARLQARATLAAPTILQAPSGTPSPLPAASAPSGSPLPLQGQSPAHKWAAPQLSQLVDRLGSPAAAAPSAQGHSAAVPVQQRSRLAVLAPSQGHPSDSGPGWEEGNAARRGGYIAAAVPARMLLACLAQPPRQVLTAQPLLFANAEAPMREPDQASPEPSPRDPDDAGASVPGAADEGANAENNPRASEGTAAPDFLDRARSVAQRLTSQRRGKKGAGAQARPWRSAVADVATIRAHVTALILVCHALIQL